ncbi:FtsH protease activity modulator HflK [Trinickia caryophylli]|nr:FtsH protease activity modulator HflK [Trinickia caryophylli]PMS11712.1 FtsH protease activity modulator HflK [Trinickia caryophylli]TRX17390.1 FtsH protease activity modulator HflK [Trinickia caryophylli]WQE11868.1 FtsH protease activity modulator HflK [Trinickia caryophylli]
MNEYNERSLWMRARAVLSISDPRWGRSEGNGNRQRPNEPNRPRGDGDGPPDLDEMWRDFNRRLSRLLGRRGSGSGPGERRPDNGRAARVGVGIVVGVLIAIYVGSGIFVVQEGQTGAVLQFGKYRRTVGPGVHLRAPYPFETHEIVNVAEVRSIEIGRSNALSDANVVDASMLTRDGDIVDVRFIVRYQVKSVADYLFRAADPDRSVAQAAQAAVREIVGTRSAREVLDQNQDALAQQLSTAIQRSLDRYRTGLAVVGVAMQAVQPPQQVQAAYADVQKAKDDSMRMKREAQAYADDLLPRAQTEAARSLDDAKAYAARVVEQARGDADRFNEVYAQYAKAPAVVRERLYLDTMRDIYSNTTKIFVSGNPGSSVVNLSVDKLLEANRRPAADAGRPAVPTPASGPAASGTPASAAAAAPASQPAAPKDALRSREALRSRSREDDLQ